MIYNNILEAIGNTPLIKLNHIVPEGAADVYVKNEGLDVGGSIKTRTALNMIERAEKEGKLNKDSIIVEPTSGNQGIGLALIGAVKGYRTIIVMPDSVSHERSMLVKHYGAEVILIHDDGDIGKAIDECRLKAEEIAASDPRVFIPQQFENPANTEAQYAYTAKEILEAMDGRVIDGFCSGIGTGGTITGIGHALKEANPATVVWAAEPENAAILSGGSIGTHVQMGIGDGLIPGILDTKVYDDICIITDDEAINTSRELTRKEGMMCGISSGTNVACAIKLAQKLGLRTPQRGISRRRCLKSDDQLNPFAVQAVFQGNTEGQPEFILLFDDCSGWSSG